MDGNYGNVPPPSFSPPRGGGLVNYPDENQGNDQPYYNSREGDFGASPIVATNKLNILSLNYFGLVRYK